MTETQPTTPEIKKLHMGSTVLIPLSKVETAEAEKCFASSTHHVLVLGVESGRDIGKSGMRRLVPETYTTPDPTDAAAVKAHIKVLSREVHKASGDKKGYDPKMGVVLGYAAEVYMQNEHRNPPRDENVAKVFAAVNETDRNLALKAQFVFIQLQSSDHGIDGMSAVYRQVQGTARFECARRGIENGEEHIFMHDLHHGPQIVVYNDAVISQSEVDKLTSVVNRINPSSNKALEAGLNTVAKAPVAELRAMEKKYSGDDMTYLLLRKANREAEAADFARQRARKIIEESLKKSMQSVVTSAVVDLAVDALGWASTGAAVATGGATLVAWLAGNFGLDFAYDKQRGKNHGAEMREATKWIYRAAETENVPKVAAAVNHLHVRMGGKDLPPVKMHEDIVGHVVTSGAKYVTTRLAGMLADVIPGVSMSTVTELTDRVPVTLAVVELYNQANPNGEKLDPVKMYALFDHLAGFTKARADQVRSLLAKNKK